MATQGKGATPKRKASVPTGDFSFPPVSMDTPRPLEQDWEIVMGYIAALILVVMLLPLLGMLYMDVLQTKKEAQTQIEKMEKLRREVQNEKQQREKDK